jgi:hypothetical protein
VKRLLVSVALALALGGCKGLFKPGNDDGGGSGTVSKDFIWVKIILDWDWSQVSLKPDSVWVNSGVRGLGVLKVHMFDQWAGTYANYGDSLSSILGLMDHTREGWYQISDGFSELPVGIYPVPDTFMSTGGGVGAYDAVQCITCTDLHNTYPYLGLDTIPDTLDLRWFCFLFPALPNYHLPGDTATLWPRLLDPVPLDTFWNGGLLWRDSLVMLYWHHPDQYPYLRKMVRTGDTLILKRTYVVREDSVGNYYFVYGCDSTVFSQWEILKGARWVP